MRRLPFIPPLILVILLGNVRLQGDASAPAAPAVQVALELSDGSRIIGEPVDLAALPLKTDFTTIDIPLRLIAEAGFTTNRAAFQVKFKNSDTLTGSLMLERLKVKTSYGEATVLLTRVAKIVVREATKP